MEFLQAPLSPGAPAALVLRFWRWWTGQLLLCLPARPRSWLRPRPTRVLVRTGEPDPELWLECSGHARPLAASAPGDPLAGLPSRLRNAVADCCLLVPARNVLTRRVRLPRAARGHAREVLGFEIDRYTPHDAEEAWFDCRELADGDDSGDTLEVELHVMHRGGVEPWLERLEAAGVPVTSIDVEASGEPASAPRGIGINLMPPQRRPRPSRGTRLVNLALVFLALGFAFATLDYPLRQRMAVVAGLEAEIAELRIDAARAEALREELAEARRVARRIGQRRRDQPLASDLLLDLTRRLPDDAWLEHLAFGGGRIDIAGQAASAAPLINRLESSPWLREVNFGAPVLHDPQAGTERFRIEAEVGSHDGSG